MHYASPAEEAVRAACQNIQFELDQFIALSGPEAMKLSVESIIKHGEKLKTQLDEANRQVGELQKTLGKISNATCRECSGSGEIGLADGEVSCPTCGGSGDPLHPGIFMQKQKREHTPAGKRDRDEPGGTPPGRSPTTNDPNRCFCAGTWHCRWCGEEPCICDPKRVSTLGRVVE